MKNSINIFYKISLFFLDILFKLFIPVKCFGKKPVLPQDSFIIATNHASYLDPMILAIGFKKRELCFMARSSLFRNIFFSFIIRSLNAFPVKKNSFDLQSVKKTSRPVIVFPEGTRTKDGSLLKGKSSFGLLAIKNDLPILPVYIDGSFQAWSLHHKIPRRGKINLMMGKIITHTDTLDSSKSLIEKSQDLTKKVMNELEELSQKIHKYC